MKTLAPIFRSTRDLPYVFAHVWAYGIMCGFWVTGQCRLAHLQNFKLPKWKRSKSSTFLHLHPSLFAFFFPRCISLSCFCKYYLFSSDESIIHSSYFANHLIHSKNVCGQFTITTIWGPFPDYWNVLYDVALTFPVLQSRGVAWTCSSMTMPLWKKWGQ